MMLPLPCSSMTLAEGLAAEIGALQIEIEDEVEPVLGKVLGRAAEGRAGAVDEDVDRAVVALHRLRQFEAGVALVTSSFTARPLPPCSSMVCCGLLGARLVHVGDDHLHADLRIADGHRARRARCRRR